jgi:hypothetical protein
VCVCVYVCVCVGGGGTTLERHGRSRMARTASGGAAWGCGDAVAGMYIDPPLVGEKTYGAALSRRRSTMRQMWLESTARQAVSESRTMAWMRRLHSEVDNRGVGVGCETSTPQGDTRETQVEVRWHMRCIHHREEKGGQNPPKQRSGMHHGVPCQTRHHHQNTHKHNT